jgi:hypothetical protein
MAGVAEFFDFLSTALGAPTAKLLIVAGLLFLGVAVVGNITGRIQPGALGRILGGFVGPLLIVGGLALELGAARNAARAQPAQVVTVVPSSTPARTVTPLRTPTPTPRPIIDPKLGTKSTAPTPTAKQIIDLLGR